VRMTFLGETHAAHHLAAAASGKGFEVVPIDSDPELVFVSMDTPTDEHGNRDLIAIVDLIYQAVLPKPRPPVVLTSAVPPGFCRDFGMSDLIYQAETLRMRDAEDRARNPEMLIVGVREPHVGLPHVYWTYLKAFDAPLFKCTWEEAEFAKVAINCWLASQVDCTNKLSQAAAKAGVRWSVISEILKTDSRIGRNAYLEPGRWQDSRHLVRDMVTLESI
jgi:UDP-glucose 6-dehydrogenase